MTRRKALINLVIVIVFFLIMTRIDYVVNCILYEHGLKFSQVWYCEWTSIYILAYVFFAVVMGYFNRSLKLGLSLLVISLISTQDIIYFLVWNSGDRFPMSMWVWMYQYKLFGYWNMATQLLLCASVISGILGVNKIWQKKMRPVKRLAEEGT